MRQEVVDYKDDTYDVLITVRAARVIDGIRRTCIMAEQIGEPVEAYLYPTCICSVDSIENRDPGKKQLSQYLTAEEFLELPEALVILWEEAAYRANPHWEPRLAPQTDKERAELTAHQQELDKRLIVWHQQRGRPPVAEEGDEEWRVFDLDGAFKVWCMLQGLDWSHLPYEGGLLEQPEALMNDLLTISWRKNIIGEMLKPTPTTPSGQLRGRR